MNWFKKVLDKLTLDCTATTEVVEIAPMPRVSKPRKMDLSEPVLSFVECYRNNPGRFIVKDYKMYSGHNYAIVDKKTKQWWRLRIVEAYTDSQGEKVMSYISNEAKWATRDELEYVADEIGNMSALRLRKLKEVVEQRRLKREANERNRLMAIYCKEV